MSKGEIDFSDEGNDYFDEGLVESLHLLVVDFELFVGSCVITKVSKEKNNVVLVGPVNSGKSSTLIGCLVLRGRLFELSWHNKRYD